MRAAFSASSRPGRLVLRARVRAAFTLVELAAAAAVLVASILAGTSLAVLAARHIGATDCRIADRDVALELLWELERLPYVAAAGAPSTVARVFPHALPSRNSIDAFYSAAASGRLPAGCFVTRHERAGTKLLLVARFLERDAQGRWRAVGDARLAGSDYAICDPPPVLIVDVRSQRPTGVRAAPLASRIYAATALSAEVDR